MKYKKYEEPVGLTVNVRGDDVQTALKVFKKKVQKSGILRELRDKRYYRSKGQKRKLAKEATLRRLRREARKLMK
ncbi:MAG: 30S ribosomal protein S21 [Rhizobiales bacterium]|nr:30S ribosomal protein S21 [Hyphomicrobiales bacterium]